MPWSKQAVEDRLRALEKSAVMVFCQDVDLRYTWVHNGDGVLLSDAAVGKTDADLLSGDDAVSITAMKRRALETGAGVREDIELEIRGKRAVYDITVEPVRVDRKITGITGVAIDVTSRNWSERILRKALAEVEELKSIIERSPVMVFRWRLAEGWPVEFVSENVRRILGYSADDFLSGRVSWAAITHRDDVPRLEAEVADYLRRNVRQWTQEYRLLTKSGEVRWFEDTNRVITDAQDNVSHIQGILFDISGRKQAEEELRKANERLRELAYRDEMTALANRKSFVESLGRELRRMRRYGGHFAVALLNVDSFKEINDTYGHQGGDEVLRAIGRVLTAEIRGSDIVARCGGDEFGILMPQTSAAAAAEVVRRVRVELAGKAVTCQGKAVAVPISAGVCCIDAGDKARLPEADRVSSGQADTDTVLQAADDALHAAKDAGGNCTHVAPQRQGGKKG